MKLIHTADLHLGAVPDYGKPWSEERAHDIWATFEEIVNVAEQQQADLLLIAGGLFDKPPLLKELREVNQKFSSLTHTKVVLQAGSSDPLDATSNYRNFQWCDQVTFISSSDITSIYFEDLNTTIYGFSYISPRIEAEFGDFRAPDNGTINILMLHGGEEGHLPLNKHRLMHAGFDYVALGAVHKSEVLSEAGVVTPGSPEPLNRTEIGAHGYVTAEITPRGRKIQFIPCAKVRYFNFSIEVSPDSTQAELMEVLRSQIERNGSQDIYSLHLTGTRAFEVNYDLKAISALGRFVELIDDTQPNYDMDELQHEHSHDLLGQYIDLLSRQHNAPAITKKALNYGIRALMATQRN